MGRGVKGAEAEKGREGEGEGEEEGESERERERERERDLITTTLVWSLPKSLRSPSLQAARSQM